MTPSTSDVAVCCFSNSVEIGSALLQFIKQPRVLDGDDSLSGKILQQCDLPVGEKTNFLAVDEDYTNQQIVLKHRTHTVDPARANIAAGPGTASAA